MANLLEAVSKDLATKSHADQISAIREAVQSLPDDQKESFAVALGANIPPPDQTTSNKVWLIIIRAFVLVMVIAVITLCITVFIKVQKDETYLAKPELILTVFTTVTAFLAGLFAPSPMTSSRSKPDPK